MIVKYEKANITKRDIFKRAKKELEGRILIPIFPEFIPWQRMPSVKNRVTWRKVGNVIESDREKFINKIPVLIMEVLTKEEAGKIIPEIGYIAELATDSRSETWIKCLWSDIIVYHRVNANNIHILKQQLVDNF